MPLKDELNGYLKLPRAFFGIPAQSSGDPDVGVLGVPYDITSSYLPGCRLGPDAIRAATDSEQSHSFPLNVDDVRDERYTSSLSAQLTLEDIGDLEVTLRLPENALIDITEAAAKLAPRPSKFLFLGGDHFITYPLFRGIKRGAPKNYGLVYFDAHADLYADFAGHPLSHATSMRRMLSDGLVEKKNVLTFDLRSALPEQREELGYVSATEVLASLPGLVKELAEGTEQVYLSVDLDVLKPQVAPGVSHPESGGVGVIELAGLIRECFKHCNIRAADIVEFNPLLD